MIPIVPAFIPESESAVRTYLKKLGFVDEIHLDVVDGKFVPNASWPYIPSGQPKAVQPYTDQFTLEVDLMVSDPLPAAVDWITAGADMLVFHTETISLENFINFEAFTHITVGISAHGATSIDTLLLYAEYADCVQLMGIEEVGLQGQPFDESVIEKISVIKEKFPHKPVTVDGSVNLKTIERLKAAGADRFIVGSAVTLQEDPFEAYRSLHNLINQE